LRICRQALGVPEDRSAAGGAHGIAACEYFLHRRGREAGECLERALGDRGAKVDVAENAIKRIGVPVIVGLGERWTGHVTPVLRGCDPEFVLRGEVMKERARGHTRRSAELIDTGCGPACAPATARR
jgi:hypothetical protein